jgi:formylglycine-generating enzyme required for sulfatase activity/DNA-binding winged helix-turn-helix (wHTH) protein/tRNA A-37 threonylcarbamoyl transferase component Bud32/dienelactone hydrolase
MAVFGDKDSIFYAFDDVVVDCEGFRVLKNGETRTLEPRAFDLLLFLLKNHGRLLDKQSIFDNVWKDAFVTDNALTRAIKEIRRVIGDDASAPRYIETIPRRGYRFIAAVKTHTANVSETVPQIAEDEARQIPPQTPEAVAAAFNYVITKKLGQGGGGVVYMAEDLRLQRTVVLKFLSDELANDLRARRRFLREARLASALEHANICAIHEINETEGFSFIVMQYAEGETLKQLINNRPLELEVTFSIALQIADALQTAHERGIIHRDIKPGNIMVNGGGRVKVLDFGLAKSIAQETSDAVGESLDITQQGALLGTPAYMSPEQARGERADHRSDIFSFGIVLYEMATGRKPFAGKSNPETMNAVINTPHTPVNSLTQGLSAELSPIVDRALAKDPEKRYQSVAELQTALRRLVSQSGSADPVGAGDGLAANGRRQAGSIGRWFADAKTTPKGRLKLTLFALTLLIVCVTSLMAIRRSINLRWAKASVQRIEQLAGEQKYFEAYELARTVLDYAPDDSSLARLLPVITDRLSVTTEPDGARLYLKRFMTEGESNSSIERQYIGTTPVINLRVGRGEYVLTLEKEGYAPVERTFSNLLSLTGNLLVPPDDPSAFQIKLMPADEVPAQMVAVNGGPYSLASRSRPADLRVQLNDFFIDKFEVSNREYKEFVVAGGYFKRQYWQQPFIKNGKTIAWEEAVKEFRDRTGLPGPRSWTGQNFPEGKADHPITDICWYEAAAYAAFRGKQLPTIFQWEKAARNGLLTHYSGYVLPWGGVEFGGSVKGHANFNSSGTVPVNDLEFGMSPFGCYQMAGNVSEWCLNQLADSFMVSGGSWGDLLYVFTDIAAFPGFYSSNKVGFRCVINRKDGVADQGARPIDVNYQVPVYTPTSEETFKALSSHYRYDKPPLQEETVEVQETAEWRREKIVYSGAGDERVIAYLYLPRSSVSPYQVIQFVPAGDVYGNYFSLSESVEIQIAPFIKAGRAVWAVVFKGFKERENPQGYIEPRWATVKRRELLVANTTDLRRGLDYLSSREDLDLSRLVYYGYSQGAQEGLIYAAVENRYKAMVLVAGSLPISNPAWLPEVTPANFTPHISGPKLMLNGKYDEASPLKTRIEPLFRLLREPKRQYIYEAGHTPPLEIIVPIINDWLDEMLGQVRRP